MTTLIVYYIYAYSFFVLVYLYFRISRRLNKENVFALRDQISYLNTRHILANLIMSSAIIASAFQVGTDIKYFYFNWNESYTAFTYTLFFLAFTLSVFAVRKDFQVHSNNVKGNERIFYFLIRVLFLVVYEIYFRIILLQAFHFLPITIAIVINVIFYSAAHAFSGKKEILGSVPFGIALCLLTIIHQSVWPAIILHLILCLTYEGLMLHLKIFKTKTIGI